MERCDEVTLVLIIRGYDAVGRPVTERASAPLRLFVAGLDLPALLAEVNATLAEPVAPPALVAKRATRG